MKGFKKLRRAAGLTQFSLSRKARVARSKIADAEAGRGVFTTDERLRVEVVLINAIRENIANLDAAIQSEVGIEAS